MSRAKKLYDAIQILDVDRIIELGDQMTSTQINTTIDHQTLPPLFLVVSIVPNHDGIVIDLIDIVEYLIKRGADVNQTFIIGGKTVTPLSVCKSVDVAEILLNYGADINLGSPLRAQLQDAEKPLSDPLNLQTFGLFSDRSKDMVQFLIEHGAKQKTCKDGEELNPLTEKCRKKCKDGEHRDDKGKCKKINKSPKKCKDSEELNPVTKRCRKKCKDGEHRDAKGKCKKSVKKSPKKCKDNEELNPVTGRCRKKCKDGENRDEKGKCKKINKSPKKCKDDEELNPVTKRCRKKCKDGEQRDEKGKCKKMK